MKKSDLKTGMTVQNRDGSFYRVLRNVETVRYGCQDILFAGFSEGSFQIGDAFDQDLKSAGYSWGDDQNKFDIVKIYKQVSPGDMLDTSDPLESDLIWERKDDDFVTLTTEDGKKIKISKKSLEELKKL